ncbi:hypothetical protein [Longimicrobium sp.]|uniref:hypothetical protein n=1 Tax=Longimicrobium sp. TaxID=2029185 RepID=UPI002B7E3664|nr:hypothetical protein [Longimicrobium sp.]HSU15170.1 hypothetical protein [Longimicrobium sp.]
MSPRGRRASPGERRERALTFLAQLAVLSSGYRVRGVSGWAHPNDFALLAGSYAWSELLAEAATGGLAEVHDATVPGAAPARLYRITQRGMETVARIVGEDAPKVRPPGPDDASDGVYVTQGGRWALDVLRKVCGDGWLAPDAVREPSERWNRTGGRPCRIVYASDLDALVASRLAKSCPLAAGCRARPVMYRVTTIGRTAGLLEWFGRDPEAAIYTDHGGSWPLLCPPRGLFLFGSGH